MCLKIKAGHDIYGATNATSDDLHLEIESALITFCGRVFHFMWESYVGAKDLQLVANFLKTMKNIPHLQVFFHENAKRHYFFK